MEEYTLIIVADSTNRNTYVNRIFSLSENNLKNIVTTLYILFGDELNHFLTILHRGERLKNEQYILPPFLEGEEAFELNEGPKIYKELEELACKPVTEEFIFKGPGPDGTFWYNEPAEFIRDAKQILVLIGLDPNDILVYIYRNGVPVTLNP